MLLVRQKEQQMLMEISQELMKFTSKTILNQFNLKIMPCLIIRNILIGNQYVAEDSVYLSVTGVTHLVNTAGTLAAPDCVRPHPVHLDQLGIKLLHLEVTCIIKYLSRTTRIANNIKNCKKAPKRH